MENEGNDKRRPWVALPLTKSDYIAGSDSTVLKLFIRTKIRSSVFHVIHPDTMSCPLPKHVVEAGCVAPCHD